VPYFVFEPRKDPNRRQTMVGPMTGTSALLLAVCDLVTSALPEVMSRRYQVTWKPDGSPVTEADILLESRIGTFLQSRIPEMTVIGEETFRAGTPVSAPWVAVLDPIDGTENFCSGLKEWGTSLSIWHEGCHSGSLLLMPELGERMMSGDIPRVPRSRIVGFSSSFSPDIASGLADAAEGRIMGCAVYNLFNVIRGSFARFVNPKGACSWDLLAGVSLAHEAGCEVLVEGEEYVGQFLAPDRRHRVDIRHRYDLHPG
jgi:myo-inositol-1(or 4)-monophosphatase